MGNPSSGCSAVQMPMSLSKRTHRQSLSLQLEQLGQLGNSSLCENKNSASALSSPKVTEKKSIASFLGNKQNTRRASASLCGTEEYLKVIELHRGASSDRKPSSFIPFQGHRRVGSGSTVTPCKSLESSFRKERTSESPREKGGSLSFKKDKSAVANLAASLFHSPTKIKRSMSMSRVTQKATEAEEVMSLRQQFQTSPDEGSQPLALYGGKRRGLHTSTQDIEDATSEKSLSPTIGSSSIGSRSSRMETGSLEEQAGVKIYAIDDISSLFFATKKVTEEELTEAAIWSSLMSEEYLSGPHCFSSEDSQESLLQSEGRTHAALPDSSTKTALMMTRDSEASLTKCESFELVARDKSLVEADRKSRVRKRRQSLSASGIGAILLKVARVSDSGPMLTRRLPKGRPDAIYGADALQAREYVLQKTTQICTSPALESSLPVSALAVCPCEFQNVIKSTSSECEPDPERDVVLEEHSKVDLEEHPKVDLAGVDSTDCSVDNNCETQQQNQQTTPKMVPRHLPNLENTNFGGACIHEGMIPTFVEVENCLQKRVERVNSNLQRTTPKDKSESQTNTHLNGIANTPAVASADERRGGVSRKKSSSRERNSYDSDSLTEGLKAARSNNGSGRRANKPAELSVMDANVAISRERSRRFISRLQAPSGISSADVFHLVPSSVSILANPSFSSSHQDRQWEKQAEAYSSGGRGTPGREDEATPVANVFLPDDFQVPSTSASLRRGFIDSSAESAFVEKGRHKRKGQGKKKGRPHTPLRSLLVADVHNRSSPGSTSRPLPEGGHFIHQIMSCIKGSSSMKSLSPKSPDNVSRRRTIWSNCMCFSIK